MRRATWTIITFALLVVFSLGTWVGWAVAQHPQETDLRPIGDIRKDVTAFVKRSKTKDADDKSAAIVDLCLLHQEIVADTRYTTHDNLASFRAVVASRLKQCKKEIEIAELRALRKAKRLARENQASKENSDELFLDNEAEKLSGELLAQTMSEHLGTVGQLTGGPTQLFSYANGNFGPGSAQDLISLIETTISPDSWQTNGGNGRMFFYRPVCALVVSASADVQDRIGDLLRNVRRLSR